MVQTTLHDIQHTSKEALVCHTEKEAQEHVMKRLYQRSTDGFTDFEMRNMLRAFGIEIPLSSVSARRNGLNKVFVDVYHGHCVVNVDHETRKNRRTNKHCLVWRWAFSEVR